MPTLNRAPPIERDLNEILCRVYRRESLASHQLRTFTAHIYCLRIIPRRSSQGAMTEQELDSTHVGSALQEVNTEGMPHRVRRNRFGDARAWTCLLADALHGAPGDMLPRKIARKEQGRGLFDPPPVTQDFQESGGEHRV